MPPDPVNRFRFAFGFAGRHLLISACLAAVAGLFVFALLYPPPFASLLGVGRMFVLLLVVDAVCGPLLTLILANPAKSRRERWVDFSLIGLVQLAALLYGLHSLWLARPVVLAFEADRLVIVRANEVETETLAQAPAGLQSLPCWGVMPVSTRKARNSEEFFESVQLNLAGVSPAMRPHWWQPWENAHSAMAQHARPVRDLIEQRPQEAATLQAAVAKTGVPVDQLRFLPLASRKTGDWVALLDPRLQIVGYVPVDGFCGLDPRVPAHKPSRPGANGWQVYCIGLILIFHSSTDAPGGGTP